MDVSGSISNFQFPLWDTKRSELCEDCGENATFNSLYGIPMYDWYFIKVNLPPLSIPFMGYYSLASLQLSQQEIQPFNSLYGIL